MSIEDITGKALLFWRSLLDTPGIVVTASSEAAGYPKENAYDGLTYDYWKPGAGGAQYLTVHLPAAQSVDYLAIAAHDLGSQGATVDLAWSDDGSTFTDMTPGGFAPASDDPLVMLFDTTSAALSKSWWRFKVSSTAAPSIGALMFGLRTPVQRGIQVGFAPAPDARVIAFTTNDSEGGQFVGRSRLRTYNEVSIDLAYITPLWMRQVWRPFARYIEQKPFFFIQNYVSYPLEVFFGYATGQPRPSNSAHKFMQVSLAARGFA